MFEFLKDNWLIIALIVVFIVLVVALIIRRRIIKKINANKYTKLKSKNAPKLQTHYNSKLVLDEIKVSKTNKDYKPPKVSGEGYDAKKYAKELVDFFGGEIDKKETEENVD